jgi:hypothetical protein
MKMARGSAMGNHKVSVLRPCRQAHRRCPTLLSHEARNVSCVAQDQHFFDAIDAEAEEHGSNCTAAIDILASRQSPSVT